MELKYKISFIHFVKYSFYHLLHSWIVWLSLCFVFLLPLWAASGMEADPETPFAFNILAAIMLSVVLSFAFLLLLLLATVSSGISKKNKTIFVETSIKIDEEGIGYKNVYSEGRYNWNILQKFGSAFGLYFLYINQNSSVIIPHPAFLDRSQRADFESLVRRKLGAQAESR